MGRVLGLGMWAADLAGIGSSQGHIDKCCTRLRLKECGV